MLDPAVINQGAVIAIVLSGIALVMGVYFIRQQNREGHMKAMLTASSFAVVFLVLYLTRLAMGYEKVYAGPLEWRMPYYILLISHILLAVANLPLGVGSLFYAYKGIKKAGSLAAVDSIPEARQFFNRHRVWVRWTVPVWLYVAVTGWIIYLVLLRWGEIPSH